MMKLSSSAFMLGAALVAAPAMAAPINVGGVVWDPDAFLDFTTTDAMYETSVANIGDVVNGYANITTLNGTSQATFCPGCELTYTFTGYTVSAIDAGTGAFTFTGGTIDVWVDNAPDFDPLLQSTAANGVLFLSLAGALHVDGTTGLLGTLHSDPTPASTGVSGDGRGFLDVVGGLAAAYFDTNTFAIDTDLAGGTGFADFQFTSSFQLLPGAGSFVSDDGRTYSLFGSNDLQGASVAVPEPASLALLGIGLVGLASMRRKNAKV